jgi:hypothetical protein
VEGADRTSVERIVGTPNSTAKTEYGICASSRIQLKDDGFTYRNRAPLTDIEKRFSSASFGYDAQGRVVYANCPAGGRLEEAPARAFQIGSTTREQVINAYGRPDCFQCYPDGSVFFLYSYYAVCDKPGSKPSEATLDGRRVFNSSAMEQQHIHINFDNRGVIRDLDMHYGITTNLFFVNFREMRSINQPLLPDDKIDQVKLKRLSQEEVESLLGPPDMMSICSCGEKKYQYMRHVSLSASDSTQQATGVDFQPDHLCKSVLGYSIKSQSSVDRHWGARVLGAAMILASKPGTSGGILPPPDSFTTTLASGKKIDPAVLEKIQAGHTTSQEIVALAGIPDKVDWKADGEMQYAYLFNTSQIGPRETVDVQINNKWVVVEFDNQNLLKTIKKGSYNSNGGQ